MELKDLREEIDKIDSALLPLFLKRMDIAAQVADYKKTHNLPIHVPSREREILQDLAEKAGPVMADYVQQLYKTIFALSKDYQAKGNK